MKLIKTMTMTRQVYDLLIGDGVRLVGSWEDCPRHTEPRCLVCLDHGQIFRTTVDQVRKGPRGNA